MKKGNKKRKGKTNVVKPKGGIAKNKGKAKVREEQDKNMFLLSRRGTLEEELSQVPRVYQDKGKGQGWRR